MRSIKYFLLLLWVMVAGSSCSSSNDTPTPNTPDDKPEVIKDLTVKLTDENKALTNPGMGWNLMYYTFDDVIVPQGGDVTDLVDWLPCDIVSFRLSWAKVEPQEGNYNWDIIDKVAKPWTDAGKRLSFKFYTNFLWDQAKKQATPLWVRDAGAQGRYLDHNGKSDDDTWMANYNDPVLLAKLENFYKAVAAHYQNSTIEFVELGSIGRVGEGNSYQIGVEPTQDELKAHIDLLKKCFPNTRWIINDDYGSAACEYAKSVGYGVDDHSIGVGSKNNPPGRAYNATILDKFKDGKATIGLEDDTWLKPDDWYCKQMIDACANYCRIHVSPSRLLLDEVKPVVATMNLKMGYRIQFPTITLPEKVEAGKEFNLAYSIKNVGVGCCTVECYPCFVLKDDSNGTTICTKTDNEVTGNMLKYGKDNVVLDRTLKINVPSGIKAKILTLYVCMVDKSDKPIINLPYAGDMKDKLYKVAQVKVK